MLPPSVQPDDTPQTVRIELSIRSIVAIVATVLALWLVARVWEVVLVLFIALVFAGTFNPLVNALEARRLARPFALFLIIIAIAAAIAGAVALVLPGLIAQVDQIIASAPDLQNRVADALTSTPLASQAEAVRAASPQQLLASSASGALPVAGRAVEVVALGVTALVLAFYLVAERERMLGFAYALLPRRFHVRVARVLLDMEVVVGGYVRGQALTSLCCGVFFFIALTVAGTQNALALAIFAAFADLVPFIGGYLAMAPAVLATLNHGPVPAVAVLVAIILYQEFESRVLIPRIYGQTLRLSPVAVLIALLVGGKLLGIVGALIALPIAAGIRVLVEDMRIELPGEVLGEHAERAMEAHAEAEYAHKTEGAPAVEAAQVATQIAQRLQKADEVPVEERRDTA